MRKIKDVLRLKLEAKLSHEKIASSLKVSKGVVTKYVGLAAAAGLDWPTICAFDETALEHRLLVRPERLSAYVVPDYGSIHHELRRKGMTLMLLWEEHQAEICRPANLALYTILRALSQLCQEAKTLNAADSPRWREVVHRFRWPDHGTDGWQPCPYFCRGHGRIELYLCLCNAPRNDDRLDRIDGEGTELFRRGDAIIASWR